jgi:hypothetical protein
VAIIRATTADERGNLSYEHEGGYLGPLDQALAVRNNGGIVIAQARRIVDRHENLHAVKVPGILIDHVVIAEHDDEHMMTFAEADNPAYYTSWRGPGHAAPRRAPSALDARKIVQRRALLELVARRVDMHKRTLAALQRQGLNPLPHSGDVCLHIADALGQARFSLVPAERPPGFYELHEASTRTTDRHGDQRVVVGNTGSLPAGRRRQMDWAIQGRNVRYCDVTMLDGLCQSIREELL